MKGLKALLSGRKGVVLLAVLLLAVLTGVIGVVQQDMDLVEIALPVAGAVAAVFFWAVAFEDSAEARAQALFNENFERQVDLMIAGTLRRLGLDENLISGIRALADAVIVTDEEQAEGEAAWPQADKMPPWPETGVAATNSVTPRAAEVF
jgi:hypothetical protein